MQKRKNPDIVSISGFFGGDPGGIRTHGLSLRRRKKCSPSLPVNVPQALDFTGFLTISGRSCFLRNPLFYPGAISRKLAELILAVGHFPGSFAKTSKLTGITFLKYPQFTKKSSVLLNSIPCCNSVHTLDDFFAHCTPMKDAAETLMNHEQEILHYFHERLTNAVCEGINSMIQAAKRKARGYNTFEGFAAMIYLVAGKLKLPVPDPF